MDLEHKLKISLGRKQCEAVLPNLASLVWMASAIDTMALWYFGRGCWGFQITRDGSNWSDDITTVMVKPLQEVKPLAFAGPTRLKLLMERKAFPARLTDPWSVQKVAGLAAEFTIIESQEMVPMTTLAEISYGLADMTVDLFKRGAMSVWCQYSAQLSQMAAVLSLADKECRDLLNPSVPNYTAGQHVGELP